MKNVTAKQKILLFVLLMLLGISSAYQFLLSPLSVEKSDYEDKYHEVEVLYMDRNLSASSLNVRAGQLEEIEKEISEYLGKNISLYMENEKVDMLLTTEALRRGLSVNLLSIGSLSPITIQKTSEPVVVIDELTGEEAIVDGAVSTIETHVFKNTYSFLFEGDYENFVEYLSFICEQKGMEVDSYSADITFNEITNEEGETIKNSSSLYSVGITVYMYFE